MDNAPTTPWHELVPPDTIWLGIRNKSGEKHHLSRKPNSQYWYTLGYDTPNSLPFWSNEIYPAPEWELFTTAAQPPELAAK